MTKTCAYCGTEVTTRQINERETASHCIFCEMDLNPETDIMIDGMRNLKNIPPVVDTTYLQWPTPKLMQLSTFELFSLLKEANRERSEMYENRVNTKTMRGEVDKDDVHTIKLLDNTLESIDEMYEFYTRKKWSIENILLKRVDHIPGRLTDSFLMKFWENSQKTNARMKPMTIRKVQQKTY
ncbi:hypothetical protein QK289_15560 [Exiguobacterium antarcticum]|uniref:Uncharacterized protein n=1 Tax=Exiguobacterium antarcticum TaxID=132920 RepID=A0ABT6R681_9BACL|nr:hypothetical protein [Exiguobacterium antarcticum]MDI3236432.1 hypothetical protein [Exiguobacterium antarcticum]